MGGDGLKFGGEDGEFTRRFTLSEADRHKGTGPFTEKKKRRRMASALPYDPIPVFSCSTK